MAYPEIQLRSIYDNMQLARLSCRRSAVLFVKFEIYENKDLHLKSFTRTCYAILFEAAISILSFAQDPQTPPGGAAQERPSFPGLPSREPEIKPYDRVITKDAKSDEGVFTVHRIKEKIFYEIPKKEL